MDNKTLKSQKRTKVKGIEIDRVNIDAAELSHCDLMVSSSQELCQLVLKTQSYQHVIYSAKIYM